MNAYSVKQQLDVDLIKMWSVLCFVYVLPLVCGLQE